ncbi:hypothetical protein K2173_016241 [Erythroxylum novogranatense]|uniref:BHLH domain-containing protein n=1 Tax=Erythroxylum novogranatense TaxID=1862640 RepID=A0AAV8SFU6_9ROSI|nr:hypothetical protein K2173_016241 [Erythroxylum novogranatense]
MNRRYHVNSKKMGFLMAKKKVKVENFATQRNLETLRMMIPGCQQEVDVETLFQKSIQHIVELKLQVHILRSLLKLYGF